MFLLLDIKMPEMGIKPGTLLLQHQSSCHETINNYEDVFILLKKSGSQKSQFCQIIKKLPFLLLSPYLYPVDIS